MNDRPPAVQSKGQGSLAVGGSVTGSVLVSGSQNLIIQAGQVMLQAAGQARAQQRDPAAMLRVLALLAAPVYDPRHPDRMPVPLDLRQEWHGLAQAVRESRAPILLARLLPPTLDTLRAALSPRAQAQHAFPHVLHFSGHAWQGGLLLEDELGQVHAATTRELEAGLRGLPQPLDLVVLNGCESAADARSAAQALVGSGLTRAAVGHARPVCDPEAVAFAACLYAELTNGHPLDQAVERASRHVTTQPVILLGDKELRFAHLTGGEPWVDDRRPTGNLPSPASFFFGRGKELVDLAHTLERPPAVGVVSGPAGIGKSSLLVEAAHRHAWRFPGGVAFAEGPRPEEVRPTAAADLLARLAGGLGLTPPPDRLEEALWQHTAAQPTLLLLDNLEGLLPTELHRLRQFLARLGAESAALLALRPPCPALEGLPTARPLPLHHGLAADPAVRYACALADRWRVPLGQDEAAHLAAAADGHPRLIETLVAQARQRDLADLLDEVKARRGDFAAQIEAVYAWSAARLAERGRLDAWAALLLFPAGRAPEGPLRTAVGKEGLDALRGAALADFDPAAQLWRWHATVTDYARAHWPLTEEERRGRLAAILPAWTRWLERLEAKTAGTAARLEDQRPNLEALIEAGAQADYEPARGWFQALHRAFPPPDRTLALRDFEAMVYRAWADAAGRADAVEDRAIALVMTGYALSALGRREAALAATQEAADLYRELARANPPAFRPDLATSLNNLGRDLSALGRREEALQATQEAADLYRELARANPPAFLPDLATSLNNLGDRLSETGQREEALAAYEEAVRTLLLFFRALPAAFADRMEYMLRDYVAACERAKREPEQKLVEEVQRLLSQ